MSLEDVQKSDEFFEESQPSAPTRTHKGRQKGSKMPEEAKQKIAAAKKAWWAAKKAAKGEGSL